MNDIHTRERLFLREFVRRFVRRFFSVSVNKFVVYFGLYGSSLHSFETRRPKKIQKKKIQFSIFTYLICCVKVYSHFEKQLLRMLVVFPFISVTHAKIICGYNFVAPLRKHEQEIYVTLSRFWSLRAQEKVGSLSELSKKKHS